jgi:ATP-dependent DNA helicase DinG
MTTPEEFLAPGGRLAARLAGWESRPQQIEMANLVAEAIAARKHAIVEAGTGVGKSLAYLVPAVLAATADQAEPVEPVEPDWDDEPPVEGHPRGARRVVISTHTIALQEQLEKKDLPFLHAVLPLEWSSTTAVGRNNYLCLRRMNQAQREQSMLEDIEKHEQLRKIVHWSLQPHDRTKMELPFAVEPEVWEEVQAEHGNCLNRACPHFDGCGWQRARRRARSRFTGAAQRPAHIAAERAKSPRRKHHHGRRRPQ